jgi:hypothetical protein
MKHLYALLTILSFTTHAIADPFPESETTPKTAAETKIATPVSPTLTWMSYGKNTVFLLSGICLLPYSIKVLNTWTFNAKKVHDKSSSLFKKTMSVWLISSAIGLALEAILKRHQNPSSNQEFRRNIMLALPAANVPLLLLLLLIPEKILPPACTDFVTDTAAVFSGAAFLGSTLWSIKAWVQGRQKSENIDKTTPASI